MLFLMSAFGGKADITAGRASMSALTQRRHRRLTRTSNSFDEIASSHCLPQGSDYADYNAITAGICDRRNGDQWSFCAAAIRQPRGRSRHGRSSRASCPTIGFLGASSRSAIDRFLAALVQRLHELGWIDGRTVAIEYRWADAQNDRMTEIATEFVRMKVDIIVTHGTAAVIAAKQATSIIPIVFAVAADPVGTGLVASLARPGGNVTGLSIQQTDTAAKRLELLRQVIPNLQRLAIIANLGSPGSVSEMLEVQTAAKTLGLETSAIGIRRAEDIAPAFKTAKGGADA
jgi:hypothetical protein